MLASQTGKIDILSLCVSSNSRSFLSRCSLRRSNSERESYGSSGRSVEYDVSVKTNNENQIFWVPNYNRTKRFFLDKYRRRYLPSGWSAVRTFSHSSWRFCRASANSVSVTNPELIVASCYSFLFNVTARVSVLLNINLKISAIHREIRTYFDKLRVRNQ